MRISVMYHDRDISFSRKFELFFKQKKLFFSRRGFVIVIQSYFPETDAFSLGKHLSEFFEIGSAEPVRRVGMKPADREYTVIFICKF